MVDDTRRTVLSAVGAGLAMSAGAGVGGAQDEQDAEDDHEQREDGARIVHLSPDAPAVDVYIDGELWFESIEPFATQTDYFEYEPGTYTVEFVPAGESREAAVLETDVTLESGQYTLAAVGEVCAVSGNSLRIATLEDDNSPTDEGAARIRGVHASPDAPAIDVVAEDGAVLMEDLEFGEAASADIPAGEGILDVREADGGDSIARFGIEPEAGSVHTGFGIGYLNPEAAPEAAPDELSFALAVTEDAAPGER